MTQTNNCKFIQPLLLMSQNVRGRLACGVEKNQQNTKDAWRVPLEPVCAPISCLWLLVINTVWVNWGGLWPDCRLLPSHWTCSGPLYIPNPILAMEALVQDCIGAAAKGHHDDVSSKCVQDHNLHVLWACSVRHNCSHGCISQQDLEAVCTYSCLLYGASVLEAADSGLSAISASMIHVSGGVSVNSCCGCYLFSNCIIQNDQLNFTNGHRNTGGGRSWASTFSELGFCELCSCLHRWSITSVALYQCSITVLMLSDGTEGTLSLTLEDI